MDIMRRDIKQSELLKMSFYWLAGQFPKVNGENVKLPNSYHLYLLPYKHEAKLFFFLKNGTHSFSKSYMILGIFARVALYILKHFSK